MQTIIEREYKFLAEEPTAVRSIDDWLRSVGIQIVEQSGVTQRDTYYDSPHRDLIRHRVALRLRETDRGSKLYFKGPPEMEDGLCSRQELEVPWLGEVSRPSKLPDSIRNEVEPFAFSRDLAPLAELSTQRQRYLLRGQGTSDAPAELVVDRVSVPGGAGGESTFMEVELELPPDETSPWDHIARRMRTELPLRPSPRSKLEHALALMGVEIGPAPVWDRPSARMPMRLAAVRVLARHFSEAQQQEAGTRLGTDNRALHKMRVAYRRLQAAGRAFERLFPPNLLTPMLETLRQSRRVMGPVRDIDVLFDWIEGSQTSLPSYATGGLSEVRERLTLLRAQRREEMLLWLTAPQRLRGCEMFEGLLEALEKSDYGRLRVRDVAPGYILDATRRALKRADAVARDDRPENVHGLRIALKRLRYTSEEFVHIYGGLNKVRKQLVHIQDSLGAYCDAENATKLFIDLGAGVRLSAEGQAALHAMIGLQFSRRDEALADFHKSWDHFSSKKLRRELIRALV